MGRTIQAVAGIALSCLLASILLPACDDEPVHITTAQLSKTPTPLVTSTSRPVLSPTPQPTATPTPQPTATPTPQPTATPTPQPTATPTPQPTATPTPTPTTIPGSHAAVDALPWLADGITEWEEFAANNLRDISSIDTETAALILSFGWVVDGITPLEADSCSTIYEIFDEHPDLAKEVLGFTWMHDDVSKAEVYALVSIRDIARSNLALAWEVVAAPFMEPPFLQRDEYALDALSIWSLTGPPSGIVGVGSDVDAGSGVSVSLYEGDSTMLDQLVGRSWFNDGLDDDEAALLHALNDSSDDSRLLQALIETPYVTSASIDLPLSGVVGLAVVRQTPFPSDDRTLATLEEGLRVMEGLMGAPLPVGDVILLLVEREFWTLEGARGEHRIFCFGSGNVDPCYMSSIVRVRNSESGPEGTLYHELGHYYLNNGPRWLTEGLAEFLQAYAMARTGGESLEQRLAYLESSDRCDDNIWQHVNPYRGGQCDYELGEKFLLGMYAALGPEAVSAALRELYAQALIFENPNQDSIYYAFLTNVPNGKEEAFRTAFRRYHGGPVVDRVLADSSDWPPLVAIYNAANGENWVNNRNWVSDAPLGAWHGVFINSIGEVTGLELAENGLVGEIPSELGSLSNLIGLTLSNNELTGAIPSELGNLTDLEELDLRYNQLGRELPTELGNLTNLEALYLDHNQLSGEIPPELGNLTNLKTLWIHDNRLSGEIPPELGNLTNLEVLLLYGNRFTGCIAAELPEIWVKKTGLVRCGPAGTDSP